MDDRIELINLEIAKCRRKMMLLQSEAVGVQTSSFVVEGKKIDVVWNQVNRDRENDLNMISNIPEFRRLVRKIEDNTISIEITAIGSATVSFKIKDNISYTMFAPPVYTINGKKIVYWWNGKVPAHPSLEKRHEMIAKMPEFSQWLGSVLSTTELIEINVQEIEYTGDYISFIAFSADNHKQYYLESNHVNIGNKIVSIKHSTPPQRSINKLLENMREFKCWVEEFEENTDPTTPIEISIDKTCRSGNGTISFIAFRTSNGKKYYVYSGMNTDEIHFIATGRQIVENLDDLVGECKITTDFSEIPELNRMRVNTLKILRKNITTPQYKLFKQMWKQCLSDECVMVADKFSNNPFLNTKFQQIVMDMIKVQMEESKSHSTTTTTRKDALLGEYTVTVRYIPIIPRMEERGSRISSEISASYQTLTTNEVSEHIIEYNKNIKNIEQGYRSELSTAQTKHNKYRHSQSVNTSKQLIKTLTNIATGEHNEDKKTIIQYQIRAIELMQANVTAVMGNNLTNKPPPTRSLVAWLSATVSDYSHSDYTSTDP